MKAEQSIHNLVAALVERGLPFERIAAAPWIASLESRLGFALPKSLRLLAMNYSFPTIELEKVELFSNLGDGSDDELSVAPFGDKKIHEWLQNNGKVQFARLATGGYDPVCLNSHEKDGRAVEQFDHEDILLSRRRVRSRVLAESLEDLLRQVGADA